MGKKPLTIYKDDKYSLLNKETSESAENSYKSDRILELKKFI